MKCPAGPMALWYRPRIPSRDSKVARARRMRSENASVKMPTMTRRAFPWLWSFWSEITRLRTAISCRESTAFCERVFFGAIPAHFPVTRCSSLIVAVSEGGRLGQFSVRGLLKVATDGKDGPGSALCGAEGQVCYGGEELRLDGRPL